MRVTAAMTLAAALLGAVACKKNDGSLATGSGSTARSGESVAASAPPPPAARAAGQGTASGSAGDAPAPSKPAGAALSAKVLDDALGDKGTEPASVVKRAKAPQSQWAAVRGKPNPANGEATAYTIWRVTAAGPATVALTPPGASARAWFDELSAIDVNDLDGDGVDDAVITAAWSRVVSGTSKQGELTSIEHLELVYIVGGSELSLGAQHATAYKTETNLDPGENPQPEESISFTYAIKPGPPLVLHVEVGASTISPKRVKGLLDPKRNPWLTAADLPIVFK
jgi:hypothetical protein